MAVIVKKNELERYLTKNLFIKSVRLSKEVR